MLKHIILSITHELTKSSSHPSLHSQLFPNEGLLVVSTHPPIQYFSFSSNRRLSLGAYPGLLEPAAQPPCNRC